MHDNRLTRYSRFSSGRVYYVFDTCVETYFRTTFFTFFSLSVFVFEDHYSPSFLELIKSYANLFFLFVKRRFNFVFVCEHPPFYGKIIRQCHAIFMTAEQEYFIELKFKKWWQNSIKNILLERWNIYLFCIFFCFERYFFSFFPTDRLDFFMRKIRKPTN